MGAQPAPFYVAGGLAAVTLAYYLLVADFPILGALAGAASQPAGRTGINHTLAWDSAWPTRS